MDLTPLTRAQFSPTGVVTTAGDLVIMAENGETAEMLTRIQTLSMRDFIAVMKAVQTVEKALSDYAYSWRDSCYWGCGVDYPEEAKAA